MIVAIALAMVGLAGESGAQGLSSNTILGRWCTEVGSYTFTTNRLTVNFTNGGQRVLNITSIQVDGPKIIVNFAEDANVRTEANRGQGSHTTFSQFQGTGMVQVSEVQDNGVATPTRVFRRC
jgi:hypothetical protein